MVLDEERAEAERRAAVALKADADARDASAARAREASVELLAAERQLVAVGRNAVVEMARAALSHRDLLNVLLDRVRVQAPSMAARDLAPLLRELRQLLGAIPDLGVKLAQEGREHRAEQGGAPAGGAPTEGGDRGVEESIADLEVAVEMLANVATRGAGAFDPSASWYPSDGLCSSVRRLAVAIGIDLASTEPRELEPHAVGYEVGSAPPVRVTSTVVEQEERDEDETDEDAPGGAELAVYEPPPPALPPFTARPGRPTR